MDEFTKCALAKLARTSALLVRSKQTEQHAKGTATISAYANHLGMKLAAQMRKINEKIFYSTLICPTFAPDL